MKSLWNDAEAKRAGRSPLAQRVYTSRLLGRSPELVLHGGGNTSVKHRERDFFGEPVDVLHVKGSGWDLATIEKQGFAPVRMEALLKMAQLDSLSDADMVAQQRAAMLDPNAPTPSVEAILHAVLPSKFVDHTHADAVVALMNHREGRRHVEEVYGDSVIVIPYVMPGFILSKEVHKRVKGADFSRLQGLILMNHGIFTFHDDARTSYELMIELVTRAERHVARHLRGKGRAIVPVKAREDLPALARLRREVSTIRGCAVLAKLDQSPKACGFSQLDGVARIATRGPLTPDHVIRTKRVPVVLGREGALEKFARDYQAYFERNTDGELTMLDPAPRWAVWPGHGTIAFGATAGEARIIEDIAAHTIETVATVEKAFGGWRALSEKRIFEMEYWELEQAKLRKAGGAAPQHRGKVAIVTGSAAGIGFACAQALAEEGAQVVGVDLSPEIVGQMEKIGGIGIVADLTRDREVRDAVEQTVRRFGGLDILVSNAGIFTAGAYLDKMEQSNWDKSMAVNLTSHQQLLKNAIPFLREGIDPAVVLVGSRNVHAPGAGAASYSCAKAGLTQLCRVAALELAPHGVRCNIVHPDAVFDTRLWTPEALARSAERYGLTVEQYKKRNLMQTEICSLDVGRMVSAMAGRLFGKTTGAQVPVDGGNDRVI
jgi:rhamnose utilization protein RhaD (predicted bifunctional aldolase and dehydrogenase)/NAD(P)-dependent dehydrogenase (short-subunit alcohol dehydrogenase family)